jgi:lipopolysaccharide transport system ATP-binding protein
MDHVYKRFRKGELFDSLRDLIPAMTGHLFRRSDLDARDAREFWALQDVTFEVERGEAFGIIGHNGAGKSTILKILSRIMQPTRGQMIVHGRLSALIEVSAGFHHDLTGRENIYLNGTILGMSRREIDSKLDAIVDFSGLEEFIDTPVKRYSSGMFARLGFSVAAHVDPDVMIVDEVLSVGDYVFQQKCISRMTEVIRGGTTVLFVSHNLRAVADLCDRCLLLEHGKAVAVGDTNDVIGRYMDSIRASRVQDAAKAVRITAVGLTRGGEKCVRFESGDKVTLEVEAVAQTACKKVAVAVYLMDDSHYSVFDTSTERLGHSPFDLSPGETLRCSIQLELNMAYGTFHACVVLYQYHTNTSIDSWEPAVTFFVSSKMTGFRGIVNCNPSVVQQSIEHAANQISAA